MDLFGLSGKVYGEIFAFLSIGFIGCSQLNGVLLRRYRSEQIVHAAMWGQVLVTATFLVGALNGWFGLAGTIALIFLFLATVGLTNPQRLRPVARALQPQCGTASALMGALQWGLGSLSSYELGVFHRRSLVPLTAVIFASSALGMLVVLWGRKGLDHTFEPDLAAVKAAGH